jgi:ketosteroid isomerase-like protein
MHANKMIVGLASLLVPAAIALANPAGCSASDIQGVEQATAEFYASLNALFAGNASGMDQSWSHADDVTYMGPMGGLQVGWDEVRAMWQAQAALKLGGTVEPRQMHVTVGNHLAVVQCFEVGDNLDAEGRSLRVSIRATNLFRNENGQWKMIGHHTDLLPYLEKKPESASAE